MNADEFIEVACNSEHCYIRLGADINMDGVDSLTVKFAEIDGDGHSIINIEGTNVYFFIFQNGLNNADMKIKNCVFQSCLFNNGGLFTSVNSTGDPWKLTLEQCKISLKYVNGERFLYTTDATFNKPSLSIQRCAIRMEMDARIGLIQDYLFGRNTEALDSHFDLDISGTVSNNSNGMLPHKIMNSYITGRIDFNKSFAIIKANGGIYHSYVALENVGYKNGSVPIAGGIKDPCFYDRELWDGGTGISVSGSYLYALPTDKCKDADYLNSIGFYVAPEE